MRLVGDGVGYFGVVDGGVVDCYCCVCGYEWLVVLRVQWLLVLLLPVILSV